jgi:hypothetical protein
MHDRDNVNPITNFPKINDVRKSPDDTLANVAVDLLEKLGVIGDPADCRVDHFEEFVTQSGGLVIVPVGGLSHLERRVVAKYHAASHR